MNILLTSVGRRAYLVKYFKETLGGDGEVHVCNSNDVSIAFKYADKSTTSPLIYSDEYIPFLLDYCKENKIDMIISLFDIDLPILSKNIDSFNDIGTKVIVSNYDFVEVCNDKWKTYLFLKERNFNVPKTFCSLDDTIKAINEGKLSYPIMIKPRFGCGSIGMTVAEDEEALRFFSKRILREIEKSYLKFESSAVDDKIIFQEMLVGQEHGIDIINDLEGNFKNAIIKKKIAMRAGETDIAEVVVSDVIFEAAKQLAECSRHIANLDCDVFLVNGVPYVLEMNARFGGGYPFSHIAGCNLPKAIVKWVNNETVDENYLTAEPGVLACKELVLSRIK